MSDDKEITFRFLEKKFGVGNETIERFEIYQRLLAKWQPAQNLVSRETLSDFWIRHVSDSAELVRIAGFQGSWLDMGSGAGFPGLVTAILQRQMDQQGASSFVHLVESNKRKVAFLRTVIRETGIYARVYDCRVEEFLQAASISPSFISARAMTSLKNLFLLSENYITKGSVCFFHKGRDINGEIEEAANIFDFDLIKHNYVLPDGVPSDGVIAEVRAIRRKTS